MKKLFLILMMMSTAAAAWAQSQLSTVRGKTKDGKTIKVDYYKGTVEDVIQSVKYQLVDELQSNVNELQGRTKTLQGKLDDANAQVKQLQKQLQNSGGNQAEEQRIRKQLTEKETQITKLNNDIKALNEQIANLQKDDMSETLASLRQQLNEKEALVTSLNKQVVNLNLEVNSLNNDKEALNKQIEMLSMQGDKAEEMRELNNRMAEKEAQITKLNNDIKALNEQNANLQKDGTNETLASLQQQLTEKETVVAALNKQVVNLNMEVNNLNKDKEALNKQIEMLSRQGDKTEGILELNNKVAEKDNRINQLNEQIAKHERTIDSMMRNKTVVVPSDKEKQLQQLREQIAAKDAAINSLNKQIADFGKGIGKPAKTPVVGLELGLGPAFMRGNMEEGWAKDPKWCKKVDVYYGTACLSDGFPLSVEAGVGIRGLKLSAIGAACEQLFNRTDADGDSYQALYSFGSRQESLSLTYVEVPLRLCFGQPGKDRVSVYAKLGITPSIKVGTKFNGQGTYSLKGYYPQWDVTLENVTELGFGTETDCYAGVEAPNAKSFVLWGNISMGAYLPFKGTPVMLNAGFNLDFPFMGLADTDTSHLGLPNGIGLLYNSGKVAIPSIEIGLVYTLK